MIRGDCYIKNLAPSVQLYEKYQESGCPCTSANQLYDLEKSITSLTSIFSSNQDTWIHFHPSTWAIGTYLGSQSGSYVHTRPSPLSSLLGRLHSQRNLHKAYILYFLVMLWTPGACKFAIILLSGPCRPLFRISSLEGDSHPIVCTLRQKGTQRTTVAKRMNGVRTCRLVNPHVLLPSPWWCRIKKEQGVCGIISLTRELWY
jgi:hypothetical protein